MVLQKPAKVIRRIANRWFPFRGQATFCLTEAEFEHRWSGVVQDLATAGYDEEIASKVRANLESRWARIIDDKPKPSVAHIRPKKPPKQDTRKWAKFRPDGYNSLRFKKEPKLKWKVVSNGER